MKDGCINGVVAPCLSITLILKQVSDKNLGLVLLKVKLNIFWFPSSRFFILHAKCGFSGGRCLFVSLLLLFSHSREHPSAVIMTFCPCAWIANYKTQILRCLTVFPYHPKLCVLAYLTWQI